MEHYIGDDKFLSFLLKSKLNEKVTNIEDVFRITKHTFEKYRTKEIEAFFIVGYEINNNYIWYWETMPEVFSWKQKYGKSLHTTFKKFVETKIDKNTNRIIIFIAHFKHPNYFVLRYDIPNFEYFRDYIDFMRTIRYEMGASISKITQPIGKSQELSKIGIIDNFKRIKLYYNIYKYNIEIFSL